jgi:hypothetical protein
MIKYYSLYKDLVPLEHMIKLEDKYKHILEEHIVSNLSKI